MEAKVNQFQEGDEVLVLRSLAGANLGKAGSGSVISKANPEWALATIDAVIEINGEFSGYYVVKYADSHSLHSGVPEKNIRKR